MRLRLAAAALATAVVAIALRSSHLRDAEGLLVTSTLAGSLLTAGLAVQPLLARRGAAVRAHRILGTVLLALAVGHVGALFLLAPDDALFALSPDGPTRARMALIATIALLAAATLGAVGPRTGWDRRSWRLVHAYLGLVVVVLGVGHAVLTNGALEGIGTPLLLGLGALGAGGVAVAVAKDLVPGRR